MTEKPRFFITTAIDYPNSRPHIGTAFEKLGADVQARYRRMEGFDVFFLMGNDENTVKVARRATELGQEPKPYCDDMARQFKEVWKALDISNDDFIQTSEERHHIGCRQFIQKVYDAGYIKKTKYSGLYCNGCESFKTEKEVEDGKCPIHKTPIIRREEECYNFELSRFQDWLLKYYDEHPDFIQPESRRNEVIAFVKDGLLDVNITRTGENWGIKVPFDPEFTIYVWFDALINYITGIGYGTDEDRFKKWWPADVHVIGKDITRFHCQLWPAMLHAAGIPVPKVVFGHGFVTIKGEKIGKSAGNAIEPMDIIEQFGSDAFRFYFLKVCPFPSDGDFSWKHFEEEFNSHLPNNYGNMFSRVVTLVASYYDGVLTGTAGLAPQSISGIANYSELVAEFREHVEAFRYHRALEILWLSILTPANQYIEANAPWKLVKTDKEAAKQVLFNMVQPLRVASILLKPFLPKGTEAIYRGFNFEKPWEDVSFADATTPGVQKDDLRILAALGADGKVTPVYPRIKLEK